MNAAELAAALREDHFFVGSIPKIDGTRWPDWCECGVDWPCPSAIAADRIEAARAVLYDPPVPSRMLIPVVRDALDGGTE